MKGFWPQSLRWRMVILTVLVVTIPMLVSGYIMITNAEEALLTEKQNKLFGAARLLEQKLGPGYEEILKQQGAQHADKATKLKVLNEVLSGYTDAVASAYAGMGVGYYIYTPEFEGIVTYGPSAIYGGKVGVIIEPSHPGRAVIQTGESRVEFGPLVRGNIMNAMIPIIRNGQAVGYVWANELTDDVRAQLAAMERNIFWSLGLGMFLSFALIIWFGDNIVRDVKTIEAGLSRMKTNLAQPITGLNGEMGEIAHAINNMAQSLLDARSLNEHIMESMGDGIITVDNEGTIIAVNKTAERLTGYSAEELTGQSYEAVFWQGKAFNSPLLDTLRTGKPHIAVRLEYHTKYGSITVSISSTRLQDAAGNFIGAVVVIRDISEFKHLEEQVKRADRLAALGELMAGVAHEVRNPLTSIKGFAQYLQESDSEEERREYMPIIVKEVDRVNKIIEELLYFARPAHASLVPVDINELLTQTLVLVKNKTTCNRVEFTLNFSLELPKAEIDAEQFKQVFLNLFINALQAIPDQGLINISTGYDPGKDEISIAFADTGTGISEADREKVFDPFYTTKERGTGLGLAVVHRIVSSHGGRITITDNPGGGTIFTVTVPVRHGGGETHAA